MPRVRDVSSTHTMSSRRRSGVSVFALLALVLDLGGIARAQSNAPEVPPAPPSIATPAPTASPEGVEKARDVAKVAAKTPIVTSPNDATRPAFQLYAEVDLPVLGVGLVFAAARLVKTQAAFCAPLCNRSDLNALDRLTAGYYSPAWSTASDFGLYGAMVVSAGLLLTSEGPLDSLNDAVVIGESALSAAAVASALTLAAGRPRPFLFGTDAPLADRQSSDAALSFLSGHASVTSAVAMSTFMTLKRLHPRSTYPYVVLALGGAASAFVATARVMAGKHFITDAVGGLLIGTSMGVLIPALHDSPVKIVPVVSERERTLSVVGVF